MYFFINTDISATQTCRDKTTYMDFVIREKCKLLRNVCPKEEFENISNLGTLEQYYEIIWKFIKVFTLLDRNYKHKKKDKCQDIEDQIVEYFY